MYTTTQLKSIIHLFCLFTPVVLLDEDEETLYTGTIKDIPWKFMNYYLSYAPCSKITDDNYAIDIIGKELTFYLSEESW